MHVTPTIWAITVVVLVAVLIFDVVIIGRKPHEPSTKETATAVLVYIALAIAFGIGVWTFSGRQYAGEFFAGWITEYSLSVDNLFVFLLIMAALRVPRQLQQFALMVGIVLALVFRAVFIAAGAALISRFSWIFFAFGILLLVTAVKLVIDYFRTDDSGEEENLKPNLLTKVAGAIFPSTDQWHGVRSFVRQNGKWVSTPMFIVILALGSTDIMFALDSIPAIYGLTKEPYLVFAANVFALMGLRQLYFLLGDMLKKLIYLSVGLAIILAFIGCKLIIEALHHYHLVSFEISTPVSLAVILTTLVVTTLTSIVVSRRRERALVKV